MENDSLPFEGEIIKGEVLKKLNNLNELFNVQLIFKILKNY